MAVVSHEDDHVHDRKSLREIRKMEFLLWIFADHEHPNPTILVDQWFSVKLWYFGMMSLRILLPTVSVFFENLKCKGP